MSKRIVIPKRGIMREESAVLQPAGSRFLAGKAGFGMTRSGGFAANCTSTEERLIPDRRRRS
jgi:hypothetical protein